MPAAHDKVAKLILREVPLARVGSFVGKLNVANVGDEGTGHGCGLGCAANGIDPAGVSDVTQAQLTAALSDKAGLKAAIDKQVASMASKLR